jgi:hypothetical protein
MGNRKVVPSQLELKSQESGLEVWLKLYSACFASAKPSLKPQSHKKKFSQVLVAHPCNPSFLGS